MGFSQQSIVEAKMLADRLQYGVRELTDSPLKAMEVETPSAAIDSVKPQRDRQAAYEKIARTFDLKAAVRLTLKLQLEFGSLEAALNEYVLSLQLELSLEAYMQNKEPYLKQKEEKRMLLMADAIVTLALLEQDLMEKIKSDNRAHPEDNAKLLGTEIKDKDRDKADPQPLPDVPKPSVPDVRPKNPADEIQRELQRINPNTLKQP